MRRDRSFFFLLSDWSEPFLSHLTIDSLSVLTREPIPGIFELGSHTLSECFLGSLVFDEFARKTGDTSSDSPSRQEPTLLTFSSPSYRSFASSSSGRHGVKMIMAWS